MSSMHNLALSGVSVRYGALEALRAIDLELAAGEALILAGPNGAGKSTLIKVLLGLVKASAGSLSVDGAARTVDNAFTRDLGYLPESVAFAENLDGQQVMQFFARARGVPRARVTQVLERVGLLHAARRRVRGYSRGMRQRLGLGIAILSEPRLLILDEPTGGLDQEGLEVLWNVLAEWRSAGRLTLIATHDLTLVERRVDRMCLLERGAVRAVDTPARLREIAGLPVQVTFTLAPSHASTGALLERVERSGEELELSAVRDVLRVRVPPDRLLPLLQLQSDLPGVVCAVRVEETGLDTVYERLLKGVA